MIKYYHELTYDEVEDIKLKNPNKTNAWFAENYPQPEWCIYPDAVLNGPIVGCSGLVTHLVKRAGGKVYCKKCEFNKDNQ